MRKSIFLTACFLFIIYNCICASQQLTTLSGTISELDPGSKVYVYQASVNKIIDSLTVGSTSFQFELPINQFDLFMLQYSMNSKKKNYPIFLKMGSNVHVNIRSQNESVTFTGSTLADEQNDYYKGIFSTNEKIHSLDLALLTAKDSSVIEKMNIEEKALIRKEEGYSILWVKNHQNSPFSVAILAYYMDKTPAKILMHLYRNLSEEATENNFVNQALAASFATKSIQEEFEIGEHVKDFILKDTSGNLHSFSKLKTDGYTLLDFWASWCGPCRRNNPEIVKLLNKYQKYFQVISISSDTDSVRWKKAIREDKMYWPNLSDLKGTDGGFMKEHKVFSYPTYIIIAPNGKIVAVPNNIAGVKEFLGKNLKELK